VRYLAVLSHAFSVAMKEWGWVAANPLRNVSKPVEPRGRVRFLDTNECSRLLGACRGSASEALYIIVVLALTTGMRRGEIMGLRWWDVNLDDACLTLHQTKNGERRVVPLVGQALELLQKRR
jgi:integrase